jgi:hypothetical protein
MSGGSYNYLCFQDALDLADLENMARRLAELAPGSAAARDTAKLAELLRRDVTTDPLREAWRCVEWFDSGDYGEDQARAAIEAYEKARRHPDGGV